MDLRFEFVISKVARDRFMLQDIHSVDAEPAAIVLGGVAVAEEAELGAYPFAGAGSETVCLVR